MDIIKKYLSPTILTRHLIKSFMGPFLIGELFFSFVILLFSMRQIIQAIIEKNIEIGLLMKLSLYSMGWTLGMTIPMSGLLAIIMTIGTLNADQEIIVMRASGIHYFRIFRPYLIFGTVIAIIMLWYQMNVVPYCMKMVTVVVNNIANYNPTALIEPGHFTILDEQPDMSRHIYVDSIRVDEDNKKSILRGVQIRKVERINGINAMTEFVYAEQGEKIEKRLTGSGNEEIKALRLYNGFVYIDDGKSDSFEKLDFHGQGYMDINLRDNFSRMDTKPKFSIIELAPGELMDMIDNAENTGGTKEIPLKKLQVELYKRTSLPFATLIFIISGFPLGIVNKRSGKGVGFGQALIVIFIYFSLFLSADAITNQTKHFQPFVAAWLGNFLIFSVGLVLYITKTTDLLWKFNLDKIRKIRSILLPHNRTDRRY